RSDLYSANLYSKAIFFPSIQPSLFNSCRNASTLTTIPEALVGSRNPMRKIFPDCCASAIVAPTSRITAHRIDAGLFIKHLHSGVIYRAERTDLSNEKCPRTLGLS